MSITARRYFPRFGCHGRTHQPRRLNNSSGITAAIAVLLMLPLITACNGSATTGAQPAQEQSEVAASEQQESAKNGDTNPGLTAAKFTDTWSEKPAPRTPSDMNQDPRAEGAVRAAEHCVQVIEWAIYSGKTDGLDPFIPKLSPADAFVRRAALDRQNKHLVTHGGSTRVKNGSIAPAHTPGTYAVYLDLEIETGDTLNTYTGKTTPGNHELTTMYLEVHHDGKEWRCDRFADANNID